MTDPLVLRPPPSLPRRERSGLLHALPLLGGLGSVALIATAGGTGARAYVAAGLFLVSAVGLAAVQLGRQRSQHRDDVAGPRGDYLRYLHGVRVAVREGAEEQRRAAARDHPDPRALPVVAETGLLRVRSPGDPLHLRVRYAVASLPADPTLVRSEAPDRPDPVAVAALDLLVGTHAQTAGLPLTVDLATTRSVAIAGADARATARALVCSAVAVHRPSDLSVELRAESARTAAWEWLKWLPHAATASATHRLVVVDGGDATGSADATLLVVDGASGDLRLEAAGRVDRVDVATAEALARRLAAGPDVDDVEPDWRPRDPGDRLRVPIGESDDGTAVVLDLKEAAEGGMGPHGLVVGATGSGKSELLRTLVLRLALAHPPEALNLVLVDFKGGTSFAGLAGLPHVSGLLTNLADDLALVDRMQDALGGELVRRQELLRATGVASARDYERDRRDDQPPLPALLVVVDEFSELLAARPELLDLFVAIGRLGRGLGLHLLLASQRLDEGRLRGLEAHLSYRIGLRTFSPQESRAVLGTPEAYELPASPGIGYLRPDPVTLVRFRAAYVSGPAPAEAPATEGVRALRPPGRAPEQAPGAATVLDAAVARMTGRGRAHRIWWPPVTLSEPLGTLLDGVESGLLPIGVVDRPRDQRQDVLAIDLRGSGGHVGVVGGPRSGKSTLLQTVVAALALTRAPAEVRVYVLDLGGALAPLAALPHIGGLASPTEPDLVRRIVREVERLVSERAQGRVDDGTEVYLVVDGWGALRDGFDDLEPLLQRIAQGGLAQRVHLVVGTARWADLRMATRDLIGTRLELRLGDPGESEIDRRAAAGVPRDRPGRGLTGQGLHFMAALPRLTADGSAAALAAEVARTWPAPTRPRLRSLPARIELAEVLARAGRSDRRLILGIREQDHAPVGWDPARTPHLLALGDPGCGKTTLLRACAHEIARLLDPGRAQVLLIDPRRALSGATPPEQLLGHLSTPADITRGVRELADALGGRLASGTVQGPAVFLLVDDYDLVGAPPLEPLVPLLRHGSDIGLHVVLARRCAGASRALYDPVLQTLRDVSPAGLLMSGPAEEGPLLGGLRARPMSPGRANLIGLGSGTQLMQVALISKSSSDYRCFRMDT